MWPFLRSSFVLANSCRCCRNRAERDLCASGLTSFAVATLAARNSHRTDSVLSQRNSPVALFENPTADDEDELDLLKAVKANLDPNVYQAKGTENMPAFGFRPGAQVVAPYRFHIPKKMFRDFAILMTIKPEEDTDGYLFAVVNSFDTVVELGVLLEGVNDRKVNISLVYSDHKKDKESRAVASFLIPRVTGKWSQLAFRVEGNEVTLFLNCQKFGTQSVQRKPKQLHFDDASKLYIAQAGAIINRNFVATPSDAGLALRVTQADRVYMCLLTFMSMLRQATQLFMFHFSHP
ncbi:unnamed protein product [Soboliphyme baturini]|uniref:LAM_G_DOMAIN domain-containing protein n=1 Tax=Soboliphyme baturini TaxID=241478 RepID=A0A183ICG7_9BILA|nr:unnamed protein product [Soboliphyme baturini]